MVPDKFPHLKNLDIYLTGRDNFRGYDFFSLVSFLEASPALEYFNLFVSMLTYLSHRHVFSLWMYFHLLRYLKIFVEHYYDVVRSSIHQAVRG
jgi:hypothetical protein